MTTRIHSEPVTVSLDIDVHLPTLDEAFMFEVYREPIGPSVDSDMFIELTKGNLRARIPQTGFPREVMYSESFLVNHVIVSNPEGKLLFHIPLTQHYNLDEIDSMHLDEIVYEIS